MKSLNLTFKGSLGKAHTLKLAYANDNLDAKTVKNTMDQLAALDLFVSNGEKIYAQPVSGKYVETTVTPVYTAEETTPAV
ncbi:DUF2922 domain-containing protein [Paucilactobacillus kaifaensis]|uniref:DUF2922 domain-containing protein n=1 Tax=Paucilactobacillus kaifaensis TaxID=2559921 RepID=UPI0010F5EA4C|nr:DUF2922 domain-containing protein [Paucilactobacillus kaifaensis]